MPAGAATDSQILQRGRADLASATPEKRKVGDGCRATATTPKAVDCSAPAVVGTRPSRCGGDDTGESRSLVLADADDPAEHDQERELWQRRPARVGRAAVLDR